MRLRSLLLRLPLLLAAVAAALLASSAPAFAASSTVHLDGGRTALTLDKGTAAVLADNGVKVAPRAPAKASGRTFTFPIVGGSVDAKTLAGTIDHSGGIKFSAGHTSLSVQDFRINTRSGYLTARVSGTKTRIPLLKLDLSGAKISRGHDHVVVSNVKATLTNTAAAALNKTFGVKLFKGGLAIGVAKVTAEF